MTTKYVGGLDRYILACNSIGQNDERVHCIFIFFNDIMHYSMMPLTIQCNCCFNPTSPQEIELQVNERFRYDVNDQRRYKSHPGQSKLLG